MPMLFSPKALLAGWQEQADPGKSKWVQARCRQARAQIAAFGKYGNAVEQIG
jgi:hypothetical protein